MLTMNVLFGVIAVELLILIALVVWLLADIKKHGRGNDR